MTLPLILNDYPAPSPPITTKEQLQLRFKETFTNIRQLATNVPEECLESFDKIEEYLKKEDVTTDLARVGFFFEWLSIARKVSATSAAVKQPISPRDWLTRCQSDFQMYTDFFTVLCRNSGVKCVIIKGYVKGAGFEAEKSSKRNCPRGRWVAVHVEGDWRFINPSWAFASDQTAKKNESKEYVLEKDLKAAQTEDQSASELIQSKEEFWFLTDPPAFNAFCHAEDKNWQLLDSEGLWTDDDFFKKPRYTEEYYKSSRWQLLIEELGVLKAEKGKCIISYTYSEPAKEAYLRYNLYMKKQPSKSLEDLRHVVFEYIDQGPVKIINLITRLPQNGLYRMEIAGVLDGDLQPLNEFVINAVNVPKKPEPFPEICTEVGVLPAAREHKVFAEEKKGIVVVEPDRELSLRFTVPAPTKNSDTTLTALLTHAYKKDEEMKKFVKIEPTKDDVNKKEVKVCLPHEVDKSAAIEYCLTILIKGAIAVMRYILTGDKELTFPRENVIIDMKSSALAAIRNNDSQTAEKMLAHYKSKLDPNLRNLITIFMKTYKQSQVPIPQEPEITNDSIKPPVNEEVVGDQDRHLSDVERAAPADQHSQQLSDVERAVLALKEALRDSSSKTHHEDLERALAAAIRLGIKEGKYEGVMVAAESALIRLYELELRKSLGTSSNKAVDEAIHHADRSCVAKHVKKTEIYQKAVNRPKNWH